MGLVALYQWGSYKHLYYELGPEEFNLYSGIFNKKRVHVPYQRIQSVDQRASLLQRMFGVCTVSIDTAGGAANKAVTVPFVQKSQAEALRRELFSRKQYQLSVQNGADPAVAAAAVAAAAGVAVPGFAPQAGGMPGAPGSMPGAPMPGGSVVPGAYPGHAPQSPGNVLDAPAELWNDVRGVFGGMHVDTGRVTYEYGMSNKELVLTGISNNTAFLLIAIGIIGAVAQVAGEVVPLLFGSFEPVVGNVVEAGSRLFGGNLIAVGVVAFLAVAAVMWVLSAIGTCISYGGFRACRRDNRIEVEHGLLQHRFQGVDVDRVQSVVVKQSFIRRLMGYCELSLGKIDAAAENSNEQNNGLNTRGLVIHPFVKLDRVPEILAGIIPEFADVPVDNKPVARVGLRRALIRRCHHPGHRVLAGRHRGHRADRAQHGPRCQRAGRHGRAVLRQHGRRRRLRAVLRAAGPGRHRRRAVVPRFGILLQRAVHAGEQRRVRARDHQFPAQKDSVRLHEDEPLPAPRPYRHRQRAHGSGHRRHDGPPDRRM